LIQNIERTEECWIDLSTNNQEGKCYVDSFYSNHMNGDKSKLLFIKEIKKGSVTFGNNAPKRIKGKGIVSLNEKTKAQNCLYVNCLKHNILSVRQMCDIGYDVNFHSKYCEIQNAENGKLVGKEINTHNNVYVFDDSRVSLYLCKTNEKWLWHRRMGHISFDNLIKVSKVDIFKGFLKL